MVSVSARAGTMPSSSMAAKRIERTFFMLDPPLLNCGIPQWKGILLLRLYRNKTALSIKKSQILAGAHLHFSKRRNCRIRHSSRLNAAIRMRFRGGGRKKGEAQHKTSPINISYKRRSAPFFRAQGGKSPLKG